jgi:4-hydroxybenzoate polyprenyltransferase
MLGGISMEKKGFFESSLDLIKSRKEVIFGVTWTTTLATIISGKGIPPITKSFLSIIAVMMLNLSVYVYNDIIDRGIDACSDKEKKKVRPIANGTVSVNNAMNFVKVTGLLGLTICYLISITVFNIGIIYSSILYLYSYPIVRFKTVYILKNLVTSIVLPVGILMGGLAVENTVSTTTLFLFFAYFAFMFFIQPAGVGYMAEDKAFTVKTIRGTLSWRQNVYLFNLGVLIIIICASISNYLFNMSYLTPVLMTIFGLPVMIYTFGLAKENGITASYKLKPVSYAFLLITSLIITLGAIF